MDQNLIKHIQSTAPALDPYGKWLFIPNAKTGSKSIGLTLNENFYLRHRGEYNWDIAFRALFASKLDDIFKFTFVRNPWDRVLSAFFFLQNTKGFIKPMWTFKDYIKQVLAKKGPSVNYHFRPQSLSFLYNGKLFDIFIGRFERLAKDWKYIADRLRLPPRLPHINTTKHKHYTAYYDYECVQIVKEIYQEEIDALGYEYGN